MRFTRKLVRAARLGAALSAATVSIYSSLAVVCLTDPYCIAHRRSSELLRGWFTEVGLALGDS